MSKLQDDRRIDPRIKAAMAAFPSVTQASVRSREELLARNGVARIAVAGLLSEMCVSATVRGALARKLQVVLVHDAHATYDLDEIPAAIVARVAEHGDLFT